MLLSVDTKQLKEALKTVKQAVASRPVIPILTGVLLEAQEDRLRLTGTDLEVALTLDLDAEVDEEGCFLVPHKELARCVDKAKTERVEISDTTDHMQVDCGVSYRLLKLVDTEEYPVIQKIETPVTVPGLRNYVKRCLPFQSTEDTRHFLNGVYLASNGKFEVVATTGKTLKAFEFDVETDEKFEAIVPAKAVQILTRQFPEDVQLGVFRESGKAIQIAFHADGMTLVSRLIEGEYPAWHYVVDASKVDRAVTVDRRELLEVMGQVGVVLKEKANGNGFSAVEFNVTRSCVELKATNPGQGEAVGLVDAEANGDFEFSANVFLMRDVLNSVEADSITIASEADSLTPKHIQADPGEYTVIMPMRL